MTDTRTDRFTIGRLSKRTGCHIETIRYYEKIRLLPEPPRNAGGHRLYDWNHLKRLRFIRRSRELGFTLDEIRDLLRLVDGGDYTCGEVLELTAVHLNEVRKKIKDLQRMGKTLAAIVADCKGGTVPDCPIIDTLFRDAIKSLVHIPSHPVLVLGFSVSINFSTSCSVELLQSTL